MKAKEKSRKNKTGSPYYIYNDARGLGFVIVSGDDQMAGSSLYFFFVYLLVLVSMNFT